MPGIYNALVYITFAQRRLRGGGVPSFAVRKLLLEVPWDAPLQGRNLQIDPHTEINTCREGEDNFTTCSRLCVDKRQVLPDMPGIVSINSLYFSLSTGIHLPNAHSIEVQLIWGGGYNRYVGGACIYLSLCRYLSLCSNPPPRGETLRPPINSVPQTIVSEIGDKLCEKHRQKSYVPV
jgi:hypothetical protein